MHLNMRLAHFFLILIGISLVNAATTPMTLFSVNNAMLAQEYKDRALYLASYLNLPENGGANFFYTNTSRSGPFLFHLELPLPSASVTIYSLIVGAIMETNVVVSGGRRLEGTLPVYDWEEIQLTKDASITTKFDFYYEISVGDLESKWIKTEDSSAITFKTIFKYYINATELNHNIPNVIVQCPVTLRRPKTVQGSYNQVATTFLTSTGAGSVDIDLAISATLVPCTDADKSDVGSCTPGSVNTPTLFNLNERGKFKLFLDNSDFALVYYLKKFKVEMKSDTMNALIDFTDSAQYGAITKGEMIFSLPMVIVGDPITISATATLSTTAARRRMQDATVSKGTNAMYTTTIGATTNDANHTSSSNSIFISVILLLGWVFLVI